jgi:hypothetical protein
MNMRATTTKVKMACQPSMTTGSRNSSYNNPAATLFTVKLFKFEDETVVLADVIGSPLRRRNAHATACMLQDSCVKARCKWREKSLHVDCLQQQCRCGGGHERCARREL